MQDFTLVMKIKATLPVSRLTSVLSKACRNSFLINSDDDSLMFVLRHRKYLPYRTKFLMSFRVNSSINLIIS